MQPANQIAAPNEVFQVPVRRSWTPGQRGRPIGALIDPARTARGIRGVPVQFTPQGHGWKVFQLLRGAQGKFAAPNGHVPSRKGHFLDQPGEGAGLDARFPAKTVFGAVAAG